MHLVGAPLHKAAAQGIVEKEALISGTSVVAATPIISTSAAAASPFAPPPTGGTLLLPVSSDKVIRMEPLAAVNFRAFDSKFISDHLRDLVWISVKADRSSSCRLLQLEVGASLPGLQENNNMTTVIMHA